MKQFAFCLLIASLLITSCLPLAGQNQKKIDSLETFLKNEDISGRDRSFTYYELAGLWLSYDSAKAMGYIKEGREWATKSGYLEGQLKELHLLGRFFFMTSQFDSAHHKFSRLITEAKQQSSGKWEGKGLSSLAKVNRAQGNIDEANDDNLKAAKIFREIDDKLSLADVYNDLTVTYRNQGDHKKTLEMSEKALQIYTELNDHFGISQITGNLGLYYKDIGDFGRSMEHFLTSISAAEEIGLKAIIGTNYVNIGTIHDQQRDYQSSRESYIKALDILKEIGYEDAVGITLNYLAAACTHEGYFKEAEAYSLQAVDIFEKNGNKDYLANSLSNLGNNHIKSGKHVEALKHLLRALSLMQDVGNVIAQPSVLNLIGEAHYRSNEATKAKRYIERSIQLATNHKLPGDLKDAVYHMSQIESALGRHKEAFVFQLQYDQLKDSLLNEEEIKKITRLQADFEYQKEKDSIGFQRKNEELVFEKALERKQSIIRAAIGGGALTLIILGLLYRSYLIKLKNNRELAHRNEIIGLKNEELTTKNTEISNLREAEKQMAEETLSMKERELTTITMLSHEKNTILQQLGDHIGSISKKVDDRIIPDLEEIKKIIKANLSEETWSSFMMQFEKVHPKFFSDLKTKFPSLTQHDLRLCSYLKVGMDNKEIAQISAISQDSVKKNVYRLKKKMALDPEQDLREFFMGF